MDLIEANMTRVAEGVAAGFGAVATVDFRRIFAPLVNNPEETRIFGDVAADMVGEANVDRDKPPGMGSEDFAFMMEKVPGAYINLGNGDGAQPHNPGYNFNDAAIPYGAAMFAELAQRKLPKGVA